MKKSNPTNRLFMLAFLFLNTLMTPQLKAQANCQELINAVEKEKQKREKFGALTVIGKSTSRSASMGKAEALNKARVLMAESITEYMQTNLQDQLQFANDGQKERFEVQVLGKSEKGSAVIGGASYQSTQTSVDLTLYGMRMAMNDACAAVDGGSTDYYNLAAMPPDGMIQTIEEAIKVFADKDESSAKALMDSWMQSELKASLQQQQKKYKKKYKY